MNRHLIRPALICAVLGTTVVGVASAQAAPAGKHAKTATTTTTAAVVAPAPVDTAHLRVTLTTNSGWAQAHLTPGKIVAAHKASDSGAGTYTDLGDGIAVGNVTGTRVVSTDLVVSETSGASQFSLEIDKGYNGTASVTVTNLNGATPRQVVSVTDSVHNVNDGKNHTVTQLSRATVLGTTQLTLPHADNRKLVLAFYYPWFASYDKATLADQPADPRNVWDAAGVESMTQQAKANGVNGFIVSWHGDARDGSAFDIAKQSAARNGQVITPYIETLAATSDRSPTNADPLVVYNWLQQALTRQSSPAFLKAADGVPVVFVYQMAALTPGQWQGAVDTLATNGQQVHLVGDSRDPAYLPLEWGLHRYAVNDSASTLTSWSKDTALTARAGAVVDSAATPRVYAGTVSPGFDDHLLRGLLNPVVSRDNGARYDATWQAALAGDPDWVLVSTWNEWYENSQIEPGVATGGQALQQTADNAAAWRATGG